MPEEDLALAALDYAAAADDLLENVAEFYARYETIKKEERLEKLKNIREGMKEIYENVNAKIDKMEKYEKEFF